MQQQHRSRIPKFGSWDSSDSSTPFTELFDDARAGRANEEVLAGRVKHSHPHKINPTTDLHRRGGGGAPVSQHGRKPSREEHSSGLHHHRQIEPPAYHIIDDSRYVPQMNHSHSANESAAAARLGEPLGGVITSSSSSSGVANASKHSPRRNCNSSSSPSWERKSEASSTPGRSRLRNSSNTIEAEKAPAPAPAPALPKFGAWDSKDPSSADGFTVIFNNARDVKKAGGSSIHIPPLGFDDKDLYPDRRNTSAQPPKTPTKKLFCCFQSPEAKA